MGTDRTGADPHGRGAGPTATGHRTPARNGTDPEADTQLGTAARTDHARPIATGESVGHFRVEGLLGRGGMGVVYAALDTRLNRRVAIKLVLGEVAGSVGSDRRVRLEREAHALARLSHPNVISVFEIGEHAGQLYIVMELVDGMTLGERLAGLAPGPERWRDVLALLLPAGEGLAAAHAAGLVHRDFKPDNVLVEGGGRVRVMDFGVAHDAGVEGPSAPGPLDAAVTAARSLTQTGALVGTPAYMSPEQFRGEKLDARSDQFAFCVVLYEALFGRRPFVGETVEVLVAAVLEGPLPSFEPAICPPAILAVLRRGLARAPAERFVDMDALSAELRASLQPPGIQREPARPRTLLFGGVLAAIVLGTGLFFALRDPTTNAEPPADLNEGGGSLEPDVIQAIIRSKFGEVRECYAETLQTMGDSSGTVLIRAVIGPAGNVESAAIEESEHDDPFLGSCIAARMLQWRFPPPAGGSVTIRYPFVLEPG